MRAQATTEQGFSSSSLLVLLVLVAMSVALMVHPGGAAPADPVFAVSGPLQEWDMVTLSLPVVAETTPPSSGYLVWYRQDERICLLLPSASSCFAQDEAPAAWHAALNRSAEEN